MSFKPTEIATMIVAGIALTGAIIAAAFTYTERNRETVAVAKEASPPELNAGLVAIGLGILRADPKEAQTNATREWAIKLIETHSGQPFSEQAKNELLNNRLRWESPASSGPPADLTFSIDDGRPRPLPRR
jgi:hypothetical protein